MSQFMTLFFLVIDAQTGRLTWVRAGHHPALFYSPYAGCCGELGGESLPLGMTGDWKYKEYNATAKPGEIFILTTDGIWEAQNDKGEMFGQKRFKKIIGNNATLGHSRADRKPEKREDSAFYETIKFDRQKKGR